MVQRRQFVLPLLAAPALLLAPALQAQEGSYPNKPIKLLVGFPPGGGIDFAARTIQPALEKALGQPVVIENKPGVGGVLAATELSRQAPDGYTVLLANTGPFAIAPYLQPKMPYQPLKQFSYIGQIAEGGYIAVTRPDHSAKDLKQFVAWVKANPGQANYASGGNGSSTHMNGELLNQVAGIDMMHVPYKGSAPAVQDLLGGQVQLLIDAGTVLLPQVKSGRLKALAVTGAARDPNLPEVPTARELGFNGMEAVGFQGLVAPVGLPKPVLDRLSTELAKVLAQPEIRAKFAAAGSEVQSRGPEAFAAFVKADNEKWSTLIKKRGIKLD
ncbi:tripartite tricarboxylate transporter substrate binding protein [Roseateles sp. DAIF2]|uniref:Bug family tripartite tricarboxylate transporter substrate binding protein n=1 Tax=Roseateles sp. DAIF2 TaxID=2714952 RepID=UPI0018A287D9|nr:tripartite tricarboxylate transporter substrate binding protein [Roseateles sp. DAIF2]QPF73976.1 tripartite tricarboxylate transporter substrate binding protein [Roseateles sp. DAIF2]